MSDFYVYRRGGWFIAVDAINHHDAKQYIDRHAPGSSYVGKGVNIAPKTATAMTTIQRQEQITSRYLGWLDDRIGFQMPKLRDTTDTTTIDETEQK